jgi:hypothetical protein
MLTGGLSDIQLMQPTQTQMQANPEPQTVENPAPDQAEVMAKRLQYLMGEIGLDAKTAWMLLQMDDKNTAPAAPLMQPVLATTNLSQPVSTEPAQSAYQENLVAQILAELEQNVAPDPVAQVETAGPAAIPDAEYQLLSSYFRSVLPPR